MAAVLRIDWKERRASGTSGCNSPQRRNGGGDHGISVAVERGA